MFSEEVRREMVKDVLDYFEGFVEMNVNERMINNLINLYEIVIDFPGDEEVEGLFNLYDIIQAYYNNEFNDTMLDLALARFFNFEPFFKKVAMIVYPEKYKELKSQKRTMMQTLTEMLEIYGDDGVLLKHFNNKRMKHIFYDSREGKNETSHTWKAYSRRQQGEKFAGVLAISLLLCYEYRKEIRNRNQINNHKALDLPEICRKYIKEYEAERLKNGFSYVPLHWHDENGQDIVGEKLDSLSKGKKEVLRVQFSGEAGCGKTTIARHFAYVEAKEYLSYVENGSSNSQGIPRVPIFIELKNLASNKEIDKVLSSVLQISLTELNEKIKEGTFTLYLDGVNEIINDNSTKRTFALSVKKMLDEYEKASVVVTDRDEVDINIRDVVTVYRSTEPDVAEIVRFVKEICKESKELYDDKIGNMIEEWLQKEAGREKRFNTPYKIHRLIQVVREAVKNGRTIPDSEYEYVHTYVTMLLERELKEKKDDYAQPGRLDAVLTYIAKQFDCFENAYFTRKKLTNLCVDALNNRHLYMDSVTCTDRCIQMGFLVRDSGDIIRFADELIFKYFREDLEKENLEINE